MEPDFSMKFVLIRFLFLFFRYPKQFTVKVFPPPGHSERQYTVVKLTVDTTVEEAIVKVCQSLGIDPGTEGGAGGEAKQGGASPLRGRASSLAAMAGAAAEEGYNYILKHSGTNEFFVHREYVHKNKLDESGND